jgi:hypothetical protein
VVSAYVRPSPRDPSQTWLELALPQGRWAILYDTTLCLPPATWTNVWLAVDDKTDRLITVERDDAAAACAVAQWSWTSDVPCAADDGGTCDAELDGAYADSDPQEEPTAIEPPVPVEPTATEAPVPTPAHAPPVTSTPQLLLAPPAPPAAATPRVEVVERTVVVVVTATHVSTPTTAPTFTPTPTRTATLTPQSTHTPTLSPTSTDVALVVADVSATQLPVLVGQSEPLAQTSWDWPLTFVIAAVVLGLVAIWLFVARSGPVMW